MPDRTITSPKKSPFTLGWLVLAVLSPILAYFVANYEQFLPYGWQTYTAPDGSFSVQLPAKPTVDPISTPAQGNGSGDVYFVTATPKTHTAYSCGYYDHDGIVGKSPDEVLVAARDGAIRKTKGTLLKEKRIEVEGYPALDTQVIAGSELYDSRMIVVGKRSYMITAFARTKEDREEKTVQRVLNSFKILRKE